MRSVVCLVATTLFALGASQAHAADGEPAEVTSEAPPAAPYRKSVVLDTALGGLGFLGAFGDLAPPGPLFRSQLGYELLPWLMPFVEGDLAFSDTSRQQPAPKTRVFPMFGFGAGGRFTVRLGERVGVFGQVSFGAMKADVAKNGLAILGFRDAEGFGGYGAVRLGGEWYMVDRHFGLGASSGLKLAQGFEKIAAGSDTPLALDFAVSLRYAF